MKTLSCALLMVVACFGLAKSASADAPNTHALVHIKNESNVKATVYYRSVGNWKVQVVEVGKSMFITLPYSGVSQVSPTLFVRFDVNTVRGIHIVEHVVVRGASPDSHARQYGTQYAIRQVPGTDSRYLAENGPFAQVTVVDKNSSVPFHQ